MTERVYFKRNVNYTIGVRLHPGDWNGKALTVEDPFVWVEADKLKDFKRANRYIIEKGLLIQVEEPNADFDVDNPNLLSDDEVTALLKGPYTSLEKRLVGIDSDSTVARILDEAKLQGKPPKTIKLLTDKLDEISEVSPLTMRGVE